MNRSWRSSSAMRSALTTGNESAINAIAACVRGSMVNSKRVAIRTARQSQLVFRKRISGSPMALRMRVQIYLPADEIVKLARYRIEEHPLIVNLARHLRTRTRDDLVRPGHRYRRPCGTSPLARAVRPRHAAEDFDDAEARPDRQRAAKDRLHLLGPRVGGDVVIFGDQAEQLVALQPPAQSAWCPAFWSVLTTLMANSRSDMLNCHSGGFQPPKCSAAGSRGYGDRQFAPDGSSLRP